MKMISFSEYEFGLIAIGERSFGVISLGVFPVGVVAIGFFPVGVVSVAAGGAIGLISFGCGGSIGLYSRAVGLGVGINTEAVGLGFSAIDPDMGLTGISPTRMVAAVLGSIPIIFFIAWIGHKYFDISKMDTAASLSWKVRLVQSEGMYISPNTSCAVLSEIRTDTKKRIHARTIVRCGSLVLSSRTQEEVTLVQTEKKGGFTYQISAHSPWKGSNNSNDDFTPEVPGLEFDSKKGRIVILAKEAPYRIELAVEKESEVHRGKPLLVGKNKLEGAGFW